MHLKIFAFLSLLSVSLAQELGIQHLAGPRNCRNPVQSGETISAHYLGTLTDGTKFDSSYDRNEPIKVQIGVGNVIKGWDQGIVGMCIGEKRRLVVPPQLGYGQKVKILMILKSLVMSF